MKIGCVVQARVGSTRLPNKTLMDIEGKLLLERVIERVKAIRGIDEIIIAQPAGLGYSPNITNIAIETGCSSHSSWVENDVLGRYYNTASSFGLDTIVRITADCPLIDPIICEQVILKYLLASKRGRPFDYVSNCHPATYPDGLDCEIFSFQALERAHNESTTPYDREHVTPYLYRTDSPFKGRCIGNLFNSSDQAQYKWSVDTLQDLEFVRSVYQRLGDRVFGADEVFELLEREPELAHFAPQVIVG